MTTPLPRGLIAVLLCCLSLFACKPDRADLILIDGVVHTMDDSNHVHQAVAIRDGKIIAVGTSDEIQFRFACDSIVNLQGGAVYPGFIDAHSHFIGYAKSLNQADLVGTASFEEVLARVDSFARQSGGNGWILGRGWDQNDWNNKAFPTNAELNSRWPDRPVVLTRVDGHAMLCNQAALDQAGITAESRIAGGAIFIAEGRPTGLLIDNAMEPVTAAIPPPDEEQLIRLLQRAQQNCYAAGLTTVADAGLSAQDIALLERLHKEGKLSMRIYAMAEPSQENFDRFLKSGPLKTDRLHVSAFKAYADGALGSRGACLLQPYVDDPGNYGLMLQSEEYYDELAAKLYAAGFQMNTHCIGDSAFRMMMRIYSHQLKKGDDRRWRIEHAQVIDTNDFHWFRDLSVWPSVQPVHAMSDQPWAENRIGKERLKGAYAYKSQLDAFGKLAFGSDFPVEDINPLLAFHAAVGRTRQDGQPFGGFMMQQAVAAEDALRAMTIWAAESQFEEKEKGTLEPGKWADIVVLERDILFIPVEKVPEVKVKYTLSAGKIVYKK